MKRISLSVGAAAELCACCGDSAGRRRTDRRELSGRRFGTIGSLPRSLPCSCRSPESARPVPKAQFFRLNVDPGVAYYFVDEASQELWGELGYDFQFDLNSQAAVDAGSPATAVTHSGRVFAGYHNTLNEAVAFTTGLEYLQGISDTSAYRINFDAGLTSKIAGNFSLATTFSLRYNHQPLPGVKDTDTTTALSLVYQLL